MTFNSLKALGAAALFTTVSAVAVLAGPIDDRIADGKPIRIGFANIPIWGYPDENGDAKGFVNEIAIGILNEMGHTNVEATVTDWGGLIPGLQANRYDMVTGGLYILESRCKNITFSAPIAQSGDAFIVPVGNPKGIETYKDILEHDAILAAGSGYNTIEAAKKEGLTDAMIMQVPGPTEMLAAVKAGRADAAGMTYFEANHLAQADAAVDVTDPTALPEWTLNWVGVGFRDSDQEFVTQFNAALAEYLGSDEMMQTVSDYGYTNSTLPGDKTMEWVCANR